MVQLYDRYELKNAGNAVSKEPILASQALLSLQQGSLLCVVLVLAAASSLVTMLLSKDNTLHGSEVKHKKRVLPYIYGFYIPVLIGFLSMQNTLLRNVEHNMYNLKVAEVCRDFGMSVKSYCQNSIGFGIALMVLSLIFAQKHAEHRWLFHGDTK